ncbi:hypothetical protein, partial [Yonghaparkia sp. Soil809]|uniref:hypothetical protein n=1 Tax=Yonghaparkia sp. Soil809 TaxID=1736417 RepID=UPI001F38B369
SPEEPASGAHRERVVAVLHDEMLGILTPLLEGLVKAFSSVFLRRTRCGRVGSRRGQSRRSR